MRSVRDSVATRSAISTALTRQTLIRLTAPLVSILAVVLLGQAQGTGAVKRFVWFAMLGWPVWLIFAATLWLGCQRFAWPYALAAAFACDRPLAPEASEVLPAPASRT